MSDLQEDFAAMAEASKQKRRDNTRNSTELLDQQGVTYVSKNGGAHLIVQAGSVVVDFWPSTGLFIPRSTMYDKERGVFRLLKFVRARQLDQRRAETDPCLDCEEKGSYPSGETCKSCGGACRVPKGSNCGVIAY